MIEARGLHYSCMSFCTDIRISAHYARICSSRPHACMIAQGPLSSMPILPLLFRGLLSECFSKNTKHHQLLSAAEKKSRGQFRDMRMNTHEIASGIIQLVIIVIVCVIWTLSEHCNGFSLSHEASKSHENARPMVETNGSSLDPNQLDFESLGCK